MADPAADPAPAAAAAYNEDVHRLPLFFGDHTKDTVTAEAYIGRIDQVARLRNWQPAQTLAAFEHNLRGKAQKWFMGNQESDGISFNTTIYNPDVKTAFLTDFRRSASSTIAVGVLDGLKQQENEDVVAFYTRIMDAFRAISRLQPDVPAPDFTDDVHGATFNALAAAAKATANRAIGNHHVRYTMQFVMTQFFLAGLKTQIQQRTMDQAPAAGFTLLRNAMLVAHQVEMNSGAKTSMDKVVAEVNGTNGNGEGQSEEVLAFRGRGRGRGRGRAMSRGGAQRGRGATSASSNKPFTGNCFHCGKPGHRAVDCRAKVGEVSADGATDAKAGNATDQQSDLYIGAVGAGEAFGFSGYSSLN